MLPFFKDIAKLCVLTLRPWTGYYLFGSSGSAASIVQHLCCASQFIKLCLSCLGDQKHEFPKQDDHFVCFVKPLVTRE